MLSIAELRRKLYYQRIRNGADFDPPSILVQSLFISFCIINPTEGNSTIDVDVQLI